jgi:hypothetical protein
MRKAILLMMLAVVCGGAGAAGIPPKVQQTPTQAMPQQPTIRVPPSLLAFPNAWIQIENKNGNSDIFTTYANPATIRQSGDKVTMWCLYDFKEAQSAEYVMFLSKQTQNEYDCKEELSREVTYILFSGNMGIGSVVPNSGSATTQWAPVIRWSVGETLWEIACGKR